MFNPERLLGGLMRTGMGRGRRRGMGSLITGGAALGLVGVAMEAVEHYMNQNRTAPGPPDAGATPIPGSAPPPPPPGAGLAGSPPVPPPAPTASGPPPPLPSQAANRPAGASSDAVLLIQAMIAAANADGAIDSDERARVLDRLETVSLSEEDRQFIMHELLAPKDAEAIAAGVSTDEMARQVYWVSLMAIEVDTDAERRYLQHLANALGLSPDWLVRIHRQVDLSSAGTAKSNET